MAGEGDRTDSTLIGVGALVGTPIALYIAYRLLKLILWLLWSGLVGLWQFLRRVCRGKSALGKQALSDREKQQRHQAEAVPARRESKESKPKKNKDAQKPAAPPAKPQEAPAPRRPVREPKRKRTHAQTDVLAVKNLKAGVSTMAVGPKYTYIACSDRSHRLYLTSSLLPGKQVRHDQIRVDRAEATVSAWCTRGDTLAVFIETDLKIKIFQIESPNALTMEGGKGSFLSEIGSVKPDMKHDIAALAVGEGGNYVVAMDTEGFWGVWKVSLGQRYGNLMDAKHGRARKWCVSPDGQLLTIAGTMSSCVSVYGIDARMGQFSPNTMQHPMAHLHSMGGHRLGMTGVAFGEYKDTKVAVTMSEDGGVKLWDVGVRWKESEDPRMLLEFEDTDFVGFEEAAFSTDLKYLALGTSGNVVIYRCAFDIKKSSAKVELVGEIAETHVHPWFSAFKFISPTVLLTSALEDRHVRLWSIPDCVPKVQLL
eukprot:Hpha_TRINITY_DN13656_c0_g1::TRINITY_DN13656_c0_g1_i1::g.122594::m.122594